MARASRNRTRWEARRRDSRDILEAKERGTVEDLATRYSVSTVTVRGDLDALAGMGALVRSHGGAIKRNDPMVGDLVVHFHRAGFSDIPGSTT